MVLQRGGSRTHQPQLLVLPARPRGTTRTRSSMHPVLELHYRIQRRSLIEQCIMISIALCAMGITITMWYIGSYIKTANHPPGTTIRIEFNNHNNNNNILTLGDGNFAEEGLLPPPQQRKQEKEQPILLRQGRRRNSSPKKKKRKQLVYHPEDPTVHQTIRQQFNIQHPNVTHVQRQEYIQQLRQPDPDTLLHRDVDYDIHDCPTDSIPQGYPHAWYAFDVLHHWNPDITHTIPEQQIHSSLCVLDWNKPSHRTAVQLYRHAEVPFILRHHPAVVETSYRWSTPQYLHTLLANTTKQRNEHSINNHFMFWRLSQGQQSSQVFVPPTDNVELSFDEWYQHAQQVDTLSDVEQVNAEHWYFRFNAALPNYNTFLYDELPMFQPTYNDNTDNNSDNNGRQDQREQQQKNHNNNNVGDNHDNSNLFMVDSDEQRGINCRFGMRGVIAESHFDPTRNWILVLYGQRRYILAHPMQCPHLELYPHGHPSGRHSSINWSTIAKNYTRANYTGPFAQAKVTEVVLQGGDALYLPTSWFHFIVSLSTNYQCNARSGTTYEYQNDIIHCGFDISRAS